MSKITQASSKLISIKKFYFNKVILFGSISLFCLVLLLLVYLGSYYSFFVDDSLTNNLPFIYNNDPSVQRIISIIVSLIMALIGSLIILLVYYFNNNKYQKEAYEVLYKELELNEIYKIDHDENLENIQFDTIFKYIGLEPPKYYYLMSLSSLIKLNFYQIHDKTIKNKNGILITSTLNDEFDGFLQIRSDNVFPIENINEKNIYQYYLDDVKKYSSPIYINSTFKKETYELVSSEVIETYLNMKKYCSTNVILTLTGRQLIIYISSWQMKMIDSLKKKVAYNAVDLKVDALTELIDFTNDIYYYISKNIRRI
jgi:hypothetical protein